MTRTLFILTTLTALAVTSAARAQVILEENPAEVLGSSLEEQRGAQIPTDLSFTDADGNAFDWPTLFDGERPVVLILGYYDCPLLCPWVFSSLQGTFNELAWRVGKEYRVVSVSIDPTNTTEQATKQRDQVLSGLRRDAKPDGWEFLLSPGDDAARLADVVGFRYAYLEESDEYVHPGVAIILSPDGAVTQYLQVSPLPEKQLRMSLMDAADGKIGSFIDKFIFSCHVYDPDAGSFVLHAKSIMNVAAVLTAVALGMLVGGLLLIERRKRRRLDPSSSDTQRTPVAGLTPAPAK